MSASFCGGDDSMDEAANPLNKTHNTFEPFKATRLWTRMQTNFRQNVPIRTRKNVKSRGGITCFTGSDAVNTLLGHLLENRKDFGKEVCREKAVKVCRVWLEEGLIHALENCDNECQSRFGQSFQKSCSSVGFVDSTEQFYQFTELFDDTLRNGPLLGGQRTPMGGGKQMKKSDSLVTPLRSRRLFGLHTDTEASTMPSAWFRSQRSRGSIAASTLVPCADGKRKAQRKDSTLNTTLTLISPTVPLRERRARVEKDAGRSLERCSDGSFSSTSTSSSDGTLVDEADVETMDDRVVHDATLSRILTLVEIPVLDGILHFKEKYFDEKDDPIAQNDRQPSSLIDLFLQRLSVSGSSTPLGTPCCRGTDKFCSSRSHPSPSVQQELEGWILSGLACLPEESLASVVKELELFNNNASKCRLLVYKKVCERYKRLTGNRSNPLIPSNYDEIVSEFFDQLLAKKAHSTAAEVCQLLVYLLPAYRRRHLRNLLRFMFVVGHRDKVTRLSEEFANLDWTFHTVGVYILKCDSTIKKNHQRQILDFMVANHEAMGRCPLELRRNLAKRTRRSFDGRQSADVADPEPDVTYCANRMSSAAFKLEAVATRDQHLVDMLNAVLDDANLSKDNKLAYAEKFKTIYPYLFEANFKRLFA